MFTNLVSLNRIKDIFYHLTILLNIAFIVINKLVHLFTINTIVGLLYLILRLVTLYM